IYSIITVHGIIGHPHRTWTCYNGGNLWLKDFLPNKIPTSHILIYRYPANLKSRSTLTISDIAQNLLKQLIAFGCGHDRPLVFIGHDIGGLVIKAVSS
ncbi:hypothetical protein K469DRAFT_612548, partial [Zopfia rhizophila CBS 207.26]